MFPTTHVFMFTPPVCTMIRSAHYSEPSDNPPPILQQSTYRMQAFPLFQLTIRKSPAVSFPFDNQVQCPFHPPLQAAQISLNIRLRDSRHWPLYLLFLHELLLTLRIPVFDFHLCVPQQPLYLLVRLTDPVPNEQLVVPPILPVAAVNPNISGRGLSLLYLSLPFHVAGRTLLIVEVAGERKREAFVEAPLVEEEGFFERGEHACQEWGAGKEDRGFGQVGYGVGVGRCEGRRCARAR